MPLSAEGQVEQKRTNIFGLQLDSLEKEMRRDPVHAALVNIFSNTTLLVHIVEYQGNERSQRMTVHPPNTSAQ